MLAGGDVALIGGEHGHFPTQVFDPISRSWSQAEEHAGPSTNSGTVDWTGPTVLLPDKTVLTGAFWDGSTYVFDPSKPIGSYPQNPIQWSPTVGPRLEPSGEHGYVLLPDGNAFSYDAIRSVDSFPPQLKAEGSCLAWSLLPLRALLSNWRSWPAVGSLRWRYGRTGLSRLSSPAEAGRRTGGGGRRPRPAAGRGPPRRQAAGRPVPQGAAEARSEAARPQIRRRPRRTCPSAAAPARGRHRMPRRPVARRLPPLPRPAGRDRRRRPVPDRHSAAADRAAVPGPRRLLPLVRPAGAGPA